MLEDEFEIDKLKRSEATNFIAEVFYGELAFILGRELDDMLMVRKHGMNSRAMSKDVLDITTKYVAIEDRYKEFLVLHLGQNSIYHQLPEILFHPLVISAPSMSNQEVVEAIRENRKREERNINFFLPFDTELFKEKVKIVNRHLNFLTDKASKENLFRIAQKILDVDLDIPKQGIYKLFLNLCRAEFFKENFPEIEDLIEVVLGLKIELKYVPNYFEMVPFLGIGTAKLGIDSGLVGKTKSEIDDVHAIIILSEPTDDYDGLLKNMASLKTILEFFIMANRKITIAYKIERDKTFALGERYLGYDTYVV
ncbi:hypothetical protein [Tenacibaculum maritimum]|uniref:Uncharacterized protein n=1 Tax=Tenacibaculum maritimum NCIMB 2154 TaxID=1349785 RepID=A0A2H1E7D0_9FLAO|nr:hypothetical protein [Tenacibaculum maritimum]MCD9561968.1 hypothetical protein [Tenacibaculum maritimum]MCD9565052.1 hypothetical protein [Tenacibaculum maritimum]MCD9579025.1 hypothetical protein [Tenacibaculum maritimum]MCD9582682.1 hypothetical protein [Tenacibaculum maritimum]MCD9583845.1 hypothetical protein [Tenacibaculum maritimum]